MTTDTRSTNKRQRILALLPCALLLGVIALFIMRQDRAAMPAAAATTPRQLDFAVFNTLCRLSIWSAPPTLSEAAFADLNAQLRLLHDTINAFDPDSELSRLNRIAAEQPVSCSAMLWDILSAAREAWRVSDGAFDVTIGPLMQLWGFYAKQNATPTPADITAALAQVGLDKVHFDDELRRVRFSVPGMRLDFGGLAKGYALDLARQTLAKHGIDSYLLDLGGNLYCSSTPPPHRETFTIGIRNPYQADQLLGTLPLADRFVASSGNYERFRIIDGRRVGHIMDPRTGQPGAAMDGVTAVTSRGLLSDVFSTAVFVGGKTLAKKLCAEFPGTGFIFVSLDPQGAPIIEAIGDVPAMTTQNRPGAVD